jgi:hypothetical protein
MMKKLVLVLGLLASACTASAPVYAKDIPHAFLAQMAKDLARVSGTPIPFRVIVQAKCPSGVPFTATIGSDYMSHVAVLMLLFSGAMNVDEFVAWLEKNDPEHLEAAAQAVRTCYAGRPRTA